MARDNLDEELTTQDIVTREHALDKELIKLIQGSCKSDNSTRALELTKLLHNLSSIDSAIKVASFYHLKSVEDKMRSLKAVREDEDDRAEVAREKRRRWNKVDEPVRQLASSSLASEFSRPAKPFQDFGPPAAVPRPGLTRAIPSTERFSSIVPSESISSAWDTVPSSPPLPPVKRKRDDPLAPSDSFTQSSDFELPPPPSKQSTKSFPPFGYSLSLSDYCYYRREPFCTQDRIRRKQP